MAIKTRIIKALDLCCPNLAECPPNAAESLIGTLNEMRDILKKTRAFDCHVQLLPNAEGMNTGAVATRVYETMRAVLQPICKITATSGDLKVWSASFCPGYDIAQAIKVHDALKIVPGVVQTTMEWKANVWMVKVRGTAAAGENHTVVLTSDGAISYQAPWRAHPSMHC